MLDHNRPSWDDYFMAIAEVVKTRSTCTRRQVGAVLVDGHNRIIGTGYNGSPLGMDHCLDGACPRGRKSYEEKPAFTDYSDCIATHAEVNALGQHLELTGALPWTMYSTCAPCPDCDAALKKFGVRVVAP